MPYFTNTPIKYNWYVVEAFENGDWFIAAQYNLEKNALRKAKQLESQYDRIRIIAKLNEKNKTHLPPNR